jgi:SDR family mycofactocin-dependent oxidoreductase
VAGRVEGKVALITGAARGQGRSHAVRLAQEGADILALDICDQIEGTAHTMGTWDDLLETQRLVEELDRRIVILKADVRDLPAMENAVATCLSELGRIDIVCANAGISSYGNTWEITPQAWKDTLDVDLTGVWHTVRAAIPPMIEAGRGGSVIITSSSAGLVGIPNLAHYTAAKMGVMGIARVLAQEVGQHFIRVNTIHPTGVDTELALNPDVYALFMPDIENPTKADAAEIYKNMNILPIPWVETVDISNAVLWLASDEARYVTGIALPVDAGVSQKYPS